MVARGCVTSWQRQQRQRRRRKRWQSTTAFSRRRLHIACLTLAAPLLGPLQRHRSCQQRRREGLEEAIPDIATIEPNLLGLDVDPP